MEQKQRGWRKVIQGERMGVLNMANIIPHASHYCLECQTFHSLRGSVFRVGMIRAEGCDEPKTSRSALATHIYQIWHENQLQTNCFFGNYNSFEVLILASCEGVAQSHACLISFMHASGLWLSTNDFALFEILQDFIPFSFRKLCVMMISIQ